MKAIFCITGLAIQGLTISAQAQTGKPNIVVIMTDQQRNWKTRPARTWNKTCLESVPTISE